jgi:hypothetical protein
VASWSNWHRGAATTHPRQVDVQPLQHHHEPGGHHWPFPGDEPIRRQPAANARGLSNAGTDRELTMMRWGMPPPPRAGGFPVTNIRNTSSPHWRAWLKPESRCLVPFNSFAEYAPEPNPETKKKDVVWFALNDDRPLFRLRWDLDRVQRRARHEVKAYPWPAPRVRFPDDVP